MNKILILGILICAVSTQYSLSVCKCSEILSQKDCEYKEQNCQWNYQNNVCEDEDMSVPTVTPSTTVETYCNSFGEKICQTKSPCAFIEAKCTFFTGCTAYVKTNYQDCQNISNRCISNGVHCIEIGDCNGYLTQQACKVNAQNKQCFWDSNGCTDLNSCDKFYKEKSTDHDCRQFMKTCTTNLQNGCIESGLNCSNQLNKNQCVWNIDQSVECYWNNSTCVDKLCENAPTTLITDNACKQFIRTCTTKIGGGCVVRTTCQAASGEASCITNILNEKCIWNGVSCVDYSCENAKSAITTNEDCQTFKEGCITQSGGGCRKNGDCGVANIESACVKNIKGFDCIWNIECKEKTCINAPSNYNTHQLCETYLKSCTVNANKNGCTDKTCENAPISLTSNTECENYLPNAFCITKYNGGCRTNTKCSSMDTPEACKVDRNGSPCFWDSSTCKDKVCSNAPTSFTDDSACSSFSSSCTVNSSSDGCVPRTCENLLSSSICTIDLTGQRCIYRPQCYKKYCSLAPKTYKTYNECQVYLSSCTVSNSGQGCTTIPLVCSAIQIQAACYAKKIINPITKAIGYPFNSCGWNGKQCVDYGCSTLSQTYTSTAQCENDYPGHNCVSANPINGTATGCMELPSTCSERLSFDNCEIYSNQKPLCIWNINLSTPICVEKSCETANATGTTGSLTTFSLETCDKYLPGLCIVNNLGNGCQRKPYSCTYLTQIQCQNKASLGGDCYWNGVICQDKICSNIFGENHNQCQSILNSCTVRADNAGCQDLSSNCYDYTTQDQCFITQDLKNCKWTGFECVNSTCADAPDNGQYNSDQACQNWQVNAQQCTVIYKVGGQGCVQRLSDCSLYTSQAQCYKTIDQRNCLWANGNCYEKSYFEKGECSSFFGTQSTCQSYRIGCTNTMFAYETEACIFDCNQMIVSDNSLTYKICQQFDTSCSVNMNGNSCVTKSDCSKYLNQDSCAYSNQGVCIWNYYQGICSLILSVSDCQFIRSSNLTHDQCQQFSQYCTASKDGTQCQEYYSNCFNYQYDYCTKAQDGLCIWQGAGCQVVASSSECQYVNKQGLTHDICQSYNSACTVSQDKNNCQAFMNYCTDYYQQQCSQSINDGLCIWNTNLPQCKTVQEDYECSFIIGSGLTHEECQSYSEKCTSLLDGSACQSYQQDCSSYPQGGCTQSSNKAKCFWSQNESQCIQINDPNTDCYRITAQGTLTFEQCQLYNSNCSVNRDGTSCVKKQQQCQDYSMAILGCVQISESQFCISSNWNDTYCIPAESATTCEKVFLGVGNYNAINCNKFKPGCTVNNDMTGCATKNCSNFVGVYSHNACNNWVNTCTVNSPGDSCITMANLCSQQDASNCVHAIEGECELVNFACVKKTCDTANFTNDSQCSAYLNTCTVAKFGGCQARQNCNSYRSQIQCQYGISGSKCFWNPTLMNCVELTCLNIEQTTLFDSYAECNRVDYELQCTVRARDGATTFGCRSRGECNTYTVEEQCRVSDKNYVCAWNTNLFPPMCQQKSCSTANTILTTTHYECQAYLNSCTLSVINNNGNITKQGCMPLTYCNQYISEDQCYIDASGVICGWNGSICDIKSCATAPSNEDFSTHFQCLYYLATNSCTVSPLGQGCVELSSCESYTSQIQCVQNDNYQLCNWDQNGHCVTRRCENAPDNVQDSETCNIYLNNCTMSNIKCRNQICEDFEFSTDKECSKAMSTCTTDGFNCILRGTCFEAMSEAGCTFAVDGTQCAWIQTSSTAYCTNRSCSTAPNYLVTESDCQLYFTNCTTKNGGGCTVKSTCDAANTPNACTYASDGTKCQWDTFQCRNRDCQDYQGYTHTKCQNNDMKCTVGVNGQCARIQNCEDTKIKAACIEGKNGPCLWIDGYANNDGTLGACFVYSSCSSLNWTSDAQCKLISSNCTTDGTKCIGITSCSETNTNGGCVTGYDGLCANFSNRCIQFQSCKEFVYKSHSQCQIVNTKCTSNGTNCVDIQNNCSQYTNNFYSCIRNNIGQTKDNQGAINSTGICTWVTSAQICRDQNCDDLLGTSHNICNSKLSGCTSNGQYCMKMDKCSTYSQKNTCLTAIGSDGTCFWDSRLCRLQVCDDIQNGKTLSICRQASCITDGTKCISKANCSTYTNKVACYSEGIDGSCIYVTGQCQKMSSCNAANGDKYACDQVSDRCQWTDNLCQPYTCESYSIYKGTCSNFLAWDQKTQQICVNNNNVCIQADPSTLNYTQCFTITKYTYTWSQKANKCLVCGSNQTTTSNDAQNNTTNNHTISDSIVLLLFIQIIMLGPC